MLSADDLTILGLITLAGWLTLSTFWLLRGRPDQLLWLSDVAMLCAAVGLLLRNRLILTAQFVGILAYHLVWLLDLAAFLVVGRMPIKAATYMVDGSLSLAEMTLSLFQHAYLIPATGWAILRLGASRKGWVFQAGQSAVVFTLTYLLTNPAHNVNWMFGSRLADQSPALPTPLAYYGIFILGPPLLLYLPSNAIANWLGKCGLAVRLGRRAIGFRLAVPAAVSLALAIAALTVARSLRVQVTLAPALLGLTLPALEAIPIDTSIIELSSVYLGQPGAERALPLRTHEGSLARAVGYSGRFRPIFLKSVLVQIPVDSIPGAPQWLTLRGHRHAGITAAAVVVSDRLYPQRMVDSNTQQQGFELQVQLGRAGTEEFGVVSNRGRFVTADDPFIVGNGVGAIYAVTIVGMSRDGPIARTPFFLFKRARL